MWTRFSEKNISPDIFTCIYFVSILEKIAGLRISSDKK